jgi:indole-3-glycerol phosphate synthase
MSTILDRIVAYKRQEIQTACGIEPISDLERRISSASPVRDFRAALERDLDVGVIAEVKKASPSAGVIRADFDPVAIAQAYECNGAACISVLTDTPSFQGHLDHLRAVRAAVNVPVLRKDFILDRHQLLQARAAGADAVLLIAEILSPVELKTLLSQTHELGMQALVELYDRDNLPHVLASGARLIGVNNRDLRTFVTSLEHTIELARVMPADVCLVSESGIRTRADLDRLRTAGARAVLVGESLMRAPDVGAQLRELLGSSRLNARLPSGTA